MQSYGPLIHDAAGLWVRDGEWYETAFRRRMTVLALPNGHLVVHNAFILKDEDLVGLKALGKIAAVIMPNSLHGTEIGWMAERLPEAKIFVPAANRIKAQKLHRVDGALETDWPKEWTESLECLPVQGLRFLNESVFFHRASRTVVMTDLVFNMLPEDFKSPVERKLMNWNRVGVGFGPSRLCDVLFTRDTQARRHSIQEILGWDFDRVIMSHGHVLASGGKNAVARAFGLQ